MTASISQKLEADQREIVVDAAQRVEWRRLYGHDNAMRLLLDCVDQLERRLGIGSSQ